MIEKEVLIINKLGLHARAAAKLVSLASAFEAHIELIRDNRNVNGKSIMGVMMLAAAKDTTITLRADGPDEEKAVAEMEALIADKFGEGE